jgi:hypothetical protein
VSSWNPSCKSMRARGSKSVVKARPQNCQSLENVLGKFRFSKPKIQFFLLEIHFSSLVDRLSSTAFQVSLTAFRVFDGFPNFAYGFLLSTMPFYFPQCFSAFRKGFLIFLKGFLIFLNGFPLTKKSKKIYLWRQVYTRLIFELHNSSPLCSLSFVIATHSSAMTSDCYALWSMEYLTGKE